MRSPVLSHRKVDTNLEFLINIVGLPLGFIMKLIYNLVGNYGISIILFTIFTKLILLPVSYKQQKNQARTQLLNPKLAKLRQKYKDKPEKYQEEQLRLYQEENLNPYASCLPSIISLILLWGVLAVVYKPMTYILDYNKDTINAAKSIVISIDEDSEGTEKLLNKNTMRAELLTMEKILANPEEFATEMDKTDPEFTGRVTAFAETFCLGSMNLSETPKFKISENSTFWLWLLPFASGIMQLILTIYMQVQQKKRNPDMPGMGGMTAMLLIMPIFSIWLAFTVPAGVGFYWLCSSFFSFVQTIGLYAWFNDARVEKIAEAERKKAKNNKRPSMMQKLLEQQEELNRQQNGSRTPANRVSYADDDAPKISRSEKEKYNTAVIQDARKRMAAKYHDGE